MEAAQQVTMDNITFFTAFLGGILSFLSPCVLPLVPGYISYISGASLKQLGDKTEMNKVKKDVLINSLFFILGFSIVFIALGASATAMNSMLVLYKRQLAVVAGILVIVFGVHLIGWIKIPFLYYEKRINVKQKPANVLGSLLVGLAFAFGWTPCIGPILASVIAVAGAQDTIAKGILLLVFYSLGLAVPFFLTAYSITLFFKFFNRIKKHMHAIEVSTGVLLIIIGIIFITDGLKYIAVWLMPITGNLG